MNNPSLRSAKLICKVKLNHLYTFLLSLFTLQFGEVDIDGSLVAAQTAGAEDIMMLNNGCLCCTVRGDLVRMIGELVNRKKGKFDHIVIETTGKELVRLLYKLQIASIIRKDLPLIFFTCIHFDQKN